MNRLALGTLLLLSTFASAQEKGPPPPRNEYYPLNVGARWVYVTPQNKDVIVLVERQEAVRRKPRVATLSEFHDAFTIKTISQNVTVEKTPFGGGQKKEFGVVMVLAEQLLVTEDGVFRTLSAGKDIKPPVKLLKAPADGKQIWAVDSESETVLLKGSFTSEKFTATLDQPRDVIVVSCRDLQVGNRSMDTDYWFAKGIGIVKQRVRLGTFELVIHLKEYLPDDKTIIKMPPVAELDRQLPLPSASAAPPIIPPLPEKK